MSMNQNQKTVRRPAGRVFELLLAERLTLVSNGSQSEATANTVYVGPIFDGGGGIETIRVMQTTHGVTSANARWLVAAECCNDDGWWMTFGTALMSPVVNTGPANTLAHSASGDYGRRIRLRLLCWSNAATANEGAVVTAAVAIKVYA